MQIAPRGNPGGCLAPTAKTLIALRPTDAKNVTPAGIPPKYSVSHTIGFLKGKSAVRVHRELMQHRRMTGLHFWATGYCVSTVGLDKEQVRQYIREQEQLESGQGDLDLK